MIYRIGPRAAEPVLWLVDGDSIHEDVPSVDGPRLVETIPHKATRVSTMLSAFFEKPKVPDR